MYIPACTHNCAYFCCCVIFCLPQGLPIHVIFNSSCDSCVFPWIVHIFCNFRAIHMYVDITCPIMLEGIFYLGASVWVCDWKMVNKLRKHGGRNSDYLPLAHPLSFWPGSLSYINRQLMSRWRMCFAVAMHHSSPLLPSPVLFSPLHSFILTFVLDR